ncbi:MAG: bifunctional UDP-N-acetylglucosamine diphosphorylase/glucosamine-1-phosphate N-acetyltransferase GlmU [Bacillota bacterium]|nr:bifunctional UDP-N-acetylglucosamine diphosphorylase/glucosamine-1-phosphate N-acetyltransferase GlmU [Bacillota bacterium]
MAEAMAVIMAAGEGKRMKSKFPKPLFTLCGRPMLEYILEAACEATGAKPVIIVGKDGQQIFSGYAERADFAVQEVQRGTGHAVMMARKYLEKGPELVLVIAGDTPLIAAKTLKRLIAAAGNASAAVLTAKFQDPSGYGRIIRNGDQVAKIIEERDCSPKEKAINEINASMYCFKTKKLLAALDGLENDNAQGEYYLTDCIAILAGKGERVAAVETTEEECLGINDREQLAMVRRLIAKRINRRLMMEGVTLIDPGDTYIDYGVRIGRDTVVYPGVFLEGSTEVGEDCILYPGSRINGSVIGNGVKIQNSVILQSSIGDGSVIGPYAYLRPNSHIGKKCRVGDFVEVKNSEIGDGSKVSHLSYIGDGVVGKDCNIGCGAVFVNYDGANKYKTIVEDGVFIGCNVNLIAPVTVKKDAYIAAGSTVTDDVPEGALCIGRERQVIKEGWREKWLKNKDLK